MSELVVAHLSHRYPGAEVPALDDVSLEVGSREILALIGGSGSGKSTLLRAIAGLEKPHRGTISLGGDPLAGPKEDVPPERRQIGMVSQSGDLFPHLTILRNTAYGLRKIPRSDRRRRAYEALELVGLEGYAKRYPSELSGGEAQRVALARALAFQPSLLLLDEPFSNLDAELRERLRSETLGLLRSKKITAIFVTHHGDDALVAGDRLAVLREGRLIQVGRPRQVWEEPADEEVAALFGPINLFPGNGASRPLFLRANQLHLCSEASESCLARGLVERVDYLGDRKHVILRLPENDQRLQIEIEPGEDVTLGASHGVERRNGS